MDWRQKIKEWNQNRLLSVMQKKAIEGYETRQEKSFWFLGIMWLGIFIVSLGLVVLGRGYSPFMPFWIKVGIIGTLMLGGLGCAAYACYRKKQLLYESALFFTFLMIGGGVGLIAQIFDVPIASAWGLLLWAIISLIVVLLSEREFLSLLWMPLFLGGILGYWHLELLLLFFADAPIVTVCVGAGLLFALIGLTGLSQSSFIRAVHRWMIVLFYLILLIGEYSIPHLLISCLVTLGFLGLMTWYTIRFHRKSLFNLTLFLIALRVVCLCLELWHLPIKTGWGLVAAGIGVLVGVAVCRWIINRRVNKQ